MAAVAPDGARTARAAGSSSQRQVARVAEYGLKYADFEVLQATLPTVRRAVPVAMVRKNAQCGRRRMANARILGTTPEYLDIKHLKVRRGRFLTPTDLATTANVAVLAAGTTFVTATAAMGDAAAEPSSRKWRPSMTWSTAMSIRLPSSMRNPAQSSPGGMTSSPGGTGIRLNRASKK